MSLTSFDQFRDALSKSSAAPTRPPAKAGPELAGWLTQLGMGSRASSVAGERDAKLMPPHGQRDSTSSGSDATLPIGHDPAHDLTVWSDSMRVVVTVVAGICLLGLAAVGIMTFGAWPDRGSLFSLRSGSSPSDQHPDRSGKPASVPVPGPEGAGEGELAGASALLHAKGLFQPYWLDSLKKPAPESWLQALRKAREEGADPDPSDSEHPSRVEEEATHGPWEELFKGISEATGEEAKRIAEFFSAPAAVGGEVGGAGGGGVGLAAAAAGAAPDIAALLPGIHELLTLTPEERAKIYRERHQMHVDAFEEMAGAMAKGGVGNKS